MTAPTPTPAAPAAPAKPRNAVEFWLVRGGIGLLVLLAAVQAHARFGYEMTLKKLQSRLAAEEQTAEPLLVSEVDGQVWGFPSQSEQSDRHWRLRTYSWRGLTQSYQIAMQYDSSDKTPAIMSLATPGAPAEPPKTKAPASSDTAATPAPLPLPMPMAGGPGMGGPGGGGPRPDPMANDKDGDGKLSKEEASERMAANIEQWDANSDGFVDKDEIEAGRARFRQQRGSGDPGGGGRPQRPAADGDTPAETTTPDAEEAKPADAASVTKPAE